MRNFFKRLSEAREALGLSQKVMAERCGVSLRSQQNYESGERLPDAAYLAAAAAAGADILYIVTGQRSQPVSATASLPPRQQALNNSYELCKPEAQIQLVQLAALLAAGLPASGNATPGTITQTISAPVWGGVAGGNIHKK